MTNSTQSPPQAQPLTNGHKNPPYGRKHVLVGHTTDTVASAPPRRFGRNQNLSINPTLMRQKNIPAIDNHLSIICTLAASKLYQRATGTTAPTPTLPACGKRPSATPQRPALGLIRNSNKTRFSWTKKYLPYNKNIQQKPLSPPDLLRLRRSGFVMRNHRASLDVGATCQLAQKHLPSLVRATRLSSETCNENLLYVHITYLELLNTFCDTKRGRKLQP